MVTEFSIYFLFLFLWTSPSTLVGRYMLSHMYPNLRPRLRRMHYCFFLGLFLYLSPHLSQTSSRIPLLSHNVLFIPPVFSVYLPSLFFMLVCSALYSIMWVRVCERWERHGGVSVRACVFACICVAETYKVRATPEVICKAT